MAQGGLRDLLVDPKLDAWLMRLLIGAHQNQHQEEVVERWMRSATTTPTRGGNIMKLTDALTQAELEQDLRDQEVTTPTPALAEVLAGPTVEAEVLAGEYDDEDE
jgi:hypothetical protein